ncbi:PadR family transcriptional regulator [Roseibacterium beibuensis]|uniref:PadR family transcriptional regulator n=1 Tax=[Roseibacterium] beibuensis TaxID=1193142 RepID=UPI00217D1BF3|nr:PadR family transcriptional regulator [Roseibacterium beibuensis]MCS6625417.1 PadR family transcriptional regulator [Roseibacterium beibuensis]
MTSTSDRIEGLTELESCVLGVVWRRGPCSAYVVRLEFAHSHSAQWSASAGSIYPAVKRLQGLGLLDSTPRPWGRRGRTELTLTSAGLGALRAWIQRMDSWTADPTSDPVRTRLFFLDALELDEERRAAIRKAEENTRSKLESLRRHVEDLKHASAGVEYLAALGGVFELEARSRWLEAIRETLALRPSSE